MLRNIASQKWRVYAWDTTTGSAKTGDAANISAYITIDDGTPAATNDAAPTEASSTNQPGYYDFDLTQAETNGAKLSLAPKSATANIAVIACPPVVYTRPQYFSLLGIESDGDLTKVNTLHGHTAQTGDSYAIVNSGTHGNAALKTLIDAVDDYVDTEVAAIVTELAKVPKSDGTATWNATALASIQSECNDALVAYDPPTKAELDTAVASVSVEEIQATAIADLFNTNSGTTYASAVAGSAVKEIADNAGGASLTVQDIVDGVWDEPIASHVGAGTTGEALDDAGAAGTPPTAGEIADAVWDEARSGHVSAGTFGEYVLADATRISGSSTAADNAEVVFATDFATNYDTTNDRWSVGVASLAANVITATSINTAAFTAAKFANGAFSGAWEFDLDSVMFGAGTAGSYMKDLPNTSEFEARTLAAASYATAANQTTIAGYLDTEIAAILADVVAIKAKTDNLPAAPAATGDIPTVAQIWTTALTEAYRSTGATGTATQLLYEILQNLKEFSIAGTTKTVKKLDGSTTAKTYTLDDATNPTAITEAT